MSRSIRAEVLLRAATCATAIVVIVLLTFVPLSSNDFWLQAAIGRIIWTSGEIPRTGLFPFTEASEFPFHAHEWLSSVVLYVLHDRLGYENLLFVKGLLGLALFGLSYRLSHRLTGSFMASLLVSLFAMAVANFRHFLRPELFALLFTVILLNLLVEYQSGQKWRYLLGCGPLALVWANCHASFPVALVIVIIFAAGALAETLLVRPRAALGEQMVAAAAAARPYAICFLLMALAMLVNPYGTQLFQFAWDVQNSNFVRSHIYEWMPTLSGPFAGSRGFWAFLAYLVFVAGVAFASWKHLPLAGALLLLVFGYLALRTQRHIAFFSFVSIYPVSVAIGARASQMQQLPLVRGGMLALLVASAGLLVRYGNMYGGFPNFTESHNFSPLFVEYVETNQLSGNVLNSYSLGAELVYRFYPRLRPAIDSRVDLYGEKYFLDVRGLNSDEQALRQFVDRHRVRYMLFVWPEFNEGIRRMSRLREDGWRIVFADHKLVLLGRPDSTYAPACVSGILRAKPFPEEKSR